MKLCLGTVQFGMNYGIQGNGQPEREKVYEMLSYAISHGVTMLDTASAYGEAEDVLGSYIKNHSEAINQVKLVSKLKPDAFQNQPVNKWAKIAEDNARDSLTKLGINKFEAYLFHNASYIFNPGAIKSLSSVVEAGLSNKIGVSVYTPQEAIKALEYSSIGAIQIPYNLFDKRLDKCGFFDKAISQGVTVFARSSLLQGLIMMDPEHLPQKMLFSKKYISQFLHICKEYNISSLNAAIGYVLNKKGIDYVVFGVDNIRQLKEYIGIEGKSIPKGLIDSLDSVFENVEEKLINPTLWNK